MKNIKDYGSIIEWINAMTESVSNYGLWKIMKGIIALAFALFVLNFAFNPEIIFEKFTQYSEQLEKENKEYRKQIDPFIRTQLKDLVYNTNALRACVMEFHNGTTNFTSLGFLYAEMTYEERRSGIEKISQLYHEVSLSLFEISEIMYKDGFWCGSMEDLSKIDNALSQTISTSGTKWLGALLLEGSDEIGFLILSFDNTIEDSKSIEREMRRVGNTIASKLDYTKINEK